jgi:hypothetical protein
MKLYKQKEKQTKIEEKEQIQKQTKIEETKRKTGQPQFFAFGLCYGNRFLPFFYFFCIFSSKKKAEIFIF